MSSEADFNAAFDSSVAIDNNLTTRLNGSESGPAFISSTRNNDEDMNRMANIIEGSRTFYIGERDFIFDDSDGIFWRKAPLSS